MLRLFLVQKRSELIEEVDCAGTSSVWAQGRVEGKDFPVHLAVLASQELSVASMDLAGLEEVWHCLQSQPGPGSAVWPELLLGISIRSCAACA